MCQQPSSMVVNISEAWLTAPSNSSNLLAQLVSVGLPLYPGFEALHNFDVIMERDESAQSVESSQVFYNLYFAMLSCWRDVANQPITTAVYTSTARYPSIEIMIIPSSSFMSNLFTPNVAAVLIWLLMAKWCSSSEPYDWIIKLITRGPTPEIVGLVQTEIYSAYNPVVSTDRNTRALPQHRRTGSLSIIADPSSNLSASNRITMHTDFRGPLPDTNPETAWLSCFRIWSSLILNIRYSTSVVTTDAGSMIGKFTCTTDEDTQIVLQAKPSGPPPHPSPLTYDEFFKGIQQVLEAVVATAQFQYLDSSIFKDGWLAATFNVSSVPEEPASSTS